MTNVSVLLGDRRAAQTRSEYFSAHSSKTSIGQRERVLGVVLRAPVTVARSCELLLVMGCKVGAMAASVAHRHVGQTTSEGKWKRPWRPPKAPIPAPSETFSCTHLKGVVPLQRIVGWSKVSPSLLQLAELGDDGRSRLELAARETVF